MTDTAKRDALRWIFSEGGNVTVRWSESDGSWYARVESHSFDASFSGRTAGAAFTKAMKHCESVAARKAVRP